MEENRSGVQDKMREVEKNISGDILRLDRLIHEVANKSTKIMGDNIELSEDISAIDLRMQEVVNKTVTTVDQKLMDERLRIGDELENIANVATTKAEDLRKQISQMNNTLLDSLAGSVKEGVDIAMVENRMRVLKEEVSGEILKMDRLLEVAAANLTSLDKEFSDEKLRIIDDIQNIANTTASKIENLGNKIQQLTKFAPWQVFSPLLKSSGFLFCKLCSNVFISLF